jgi:DNA-binding beta-propeller fold protein YncE
MRLVLILASFLLAAADAGTVSSSVDAGLPPGAASGKVLRGTALKLPGPSRIGMDYLAYDPQTDQVWVPASNTGSTVVIDAGRRKIQTVDGFLTVTKDNRTAGPTSVTIGEAFAYVGNRADSSICPVEKKTLKLGSCVKLDSTPDGVAYVATTKEVWITAPRDNSLRIVDARGAKLTAKGKVPLEGEPEGYAVDPGRGIFYTNLRDKDATLAIDVRTRQVTATYPLNCGKAGPRGLSIDLDKQLLFVACTDHAATLALRAGGKLVSQAPTGDGVDNPDYLPGRQLLYLASGKAATLHVLRVANDGGLTQVAYAPTAAGGRVVVVDRRGTAFVADSAGGQLIVVEPP